MKVTARRSPIFPHSTFARLQTPLMRPAAGSLKPQVTRKGHSTIPGLWSR